MAIEITQSEFEAAALVVIADDDGAFQWSSDKTPEEVAGWMRHAARSVAMDAGVRICRVCGCTDLAACDPPCSWAGDDICSSHA